MIHVEELHFAYGNGPPVLKGVNLSAERGEAILLSGPSGGGKSTLLRALCGLVPHFHGGTISGRVEVAGLDPVRAGPATLAGRVAYAFQEPENQAVFDTVGRDIAFGPRAAGWPGRRVEEAVARVSRLIGVADLLGREISTLSGGERQRAGLAAALATGPDVVLLDEPTSQLDADGVGLLIDLLSELADGGMTVVVAEHRADQLAALDCRPVQVGQGDPAPLPPGAGAKAIARTGRAVHVDDLHCGYPGRDVIRGLTATFAPGEISILDGPNGSGKSTLMRAIAGHLDDVRGTISLGSRSLCGPAEARFPDVAHVAQDAARHMLTESVGDEIGYGLRRVGVADRSARERREAVARELELSGLMQRNPRDLSVGQRQLVVLAGALAAEPAALILDEPTRGLDPRRTRLLTAALRRRASRGAVVMIASHDTSFSAEVADARLELAPPSALHEGARV